MIYTSRLRTGFDSGGSLLTPVVDPPGMVELCLILRATILPIRGNIRERTILGNTSRLQANGDSKFFLEVDTTSLKYIH